MNDLSFKRIFVSGSIFFMLLILQSCGPAEHKNSGKNDSTTAKPTAAEKTDNQFLQSKFPALDTLYFNAKVLDTLSNNKALVFNYFVTDTGVTMRLWLFKKGNKEPEYPPRPLATLTNGRKAIDLEKMSLSTLTLTNSDIKGIQHLIKTNPGLVTVVLAPTIDAARPDGFYWNILLSEQLLSAYNKEDISTWILATTPTSTYLNPSPPRELAK